METNGTKTPTLISFPAPSEPMTIKFEKLPDHLKPQAAPDILAGKTWFYYGNLVESPGADELRRWIPNARGFVAICGSESATNGNDFVSICETESAAPAGNKSSGAMFKNADISRNRESVPHAKKRILADALIAMKSNLSNRELARVAGVSHTYIANRRKIARSGNKSA